MNLIKRQSIYIPANSSATFTFNNVRGVALISGLFQGYGMTSLLVCLFNGSLNNIINLKTGS